MRQHLDIAELYARAVRRLPETMDGQAHLPVPASCPIALHDVLSEP